MPSRISNFLTHTIVEEIGNFTNIKELYLHHNIVQGTYHDNWKLAMMLIPKILWRLVGNLEIVDLLINKFGV